MTSRHWEGVSDLGDSVHFAALLSPRGYRKFFIPFFFLLHDSTLSHGELSTEC